MNRLSGDMAGAYDGDAPQQGWSSSGQLNTGNGTQSVSCQAVFPEAGGYTIQFGVSAPTDGEPFQANATISWSVAGNTVTRVVTIANGTEVSAPAEGVRVIVNDATPKVLSPTGAKYNVTINIVKGLRAPNSRLPVLVPNNQGDLPPNGTAGPFPIPQSSGVIAVDIQACPTNTNTWQDFIVRFQTKTGQNVSSYTQTTGAPGMVTVPPVATQIVLDNTNGTSDMETFIQWGIDG